MDAVYRGTVGGLIQELQTKLPRILAGMEAGPDPDIVKGFQQRIANAVLSQVKQDFIRKSRGGVGLDGIKWQPLKRETIAQRRTTREERKSLGITGKRERGILTPEQNRLWKKEFARAIRWLRLENGEKEAASGAAKIAWARVKEAGGQTKLAVLGGRQVDILRDTGTLLRSLSAAEIETEPYTGEDADKQVRRFEPGVVVVGTAEKPWHHAGIPGKLPSRPLWPLDGSIPAAWWPPIMAASTRGVEEAIKQLLSRAKA